MTRSLFTALVFCCVLAANTQAQTVWECCEGQPTIFSLLADVKTGLWVPLVPSPTSDLETTPRIVAGDGTYLGRLSLDPFDPESINNPYSWYANPYNPSSILNPYGRYGSPLSPLSVTNPWTLQAPSVVTPQGDVLGAVSVDPFVGSEIGTWLLKLR